MDIHFLILVAGVLLIDSGYIWVQGRAVQRADGELVPPWWVVALGITYGPATIALYLDGWPKIVGAWVFFLVGLTAWPVARLVDSRRKILAGLAEDGRDIAQRRHLRAGHGLDEAIRVLQECEDASVDEVAKWTAESPAARHAISRWDAAKKATPIPKAPPPSNGVTVVPP